MEPREEQLQDQEVCLPGQVQQEEEGGKTQDQETDLIRSQKQTSEQIPEDQGQNFEEEEQFQEEEVGEDITPPEDQAQDDSPIGEEMVQD